MVKPTEIGINFTALNDVQPPNLNIPTDIKSLLDQIPIVANELTAGNLGYFISITFFVLVYLILSDKTPYGDFGFSDIRALTLASGVSATFIILHLMIGFVTNYKVVAFFVGLFVLFNIILLFIENKE